MSYQEPSVDYDAGLLARVETLARLVETECAHENRTGRDWCCSHCHSIAYAIRGLLPTTRHDRGCAAGIAASARCQCVTPPASGSA